MKKMILVILVVGSASVMHAQEKQSLKNLLFSGKLKKDSTGVIRSTDDLSTKIETGTKKDTQSVAVATNVAANAQQDNNSVIPSTTQQVNNPAAKTAVIPGVVANGADTATNKPDTAAAVAVAATTPPPKSNTRLLKEYTDSVVRTLQDEALKSKQIKKNTYYLMLDYEIDTDGQVTFTNVTSTPENSFLQAQVKQILDSTPLRLNPVTDSNNQAKKVKRKQQISVTKE
jgi:hypothetical protein